MSDRPSITPLPAARYLVADAEGVGPAEAGHFGHRRIVHAVRSGGDTWIFFDGTVYVVPSSAGSQVRRSAGADDAAALAAPMPATVVAVNVEDGQTVERGDVLVTLEAMKMEIAIRAPRNGTVARINCQPGELVQPGVPLLELD